MDTSPGRGQGNDSASSAGDRGGEKVTDIEGKGLTWAKTIAGKIGGYRDKPLENGYRT